MLASLRCLVVAAAATVVSLGVASSATAAPAGVPLPFLSAPMDILVSDDPAAPYVYMSGIRPDRTGVVAVFTQEGAPVAEFDAGADAGGLVLQDGVLYVAQCDSSQLLRFDAATFTDLGSVDLPEALFGCDIEWAGGRLWGAGSFNTLEALDPATGSVDRYPNLQTIDGLTAAGGALLYAKVDDTSDGFQSPRPSIVDVSSGAPVISRTGPDVQERDATMSLDGTRVVRGTTTTVADLSSSNLSAPTLRYDTDGGSSAVAVSPDGAYVAAGRDPLHEVLVFRSGQPTITRRYTGFRQIAQHGLAFGPAGRLYVVTQDGYYSSPRLVVLEGTNKAQPRLVVEAPRRAVRYGGWATVAAHLTGGPAGAVVSLFARPYGKKAWTRVARGHVDASGRLRFRFRPDRFTAFTASYAGSTLYLPAEAPRAGVYVAPRILVRQTGSYGRQGAYRLYHQGTHPGIVAAVVPGHPGKCVRFQISHRQGGGWTTPTTSGCFHLDRRSLAAAVYVGQTSVGSRFRQRAIFAGDADHESAESGWAYFQVTR